MTSETTPQTSKEELDDRQKKIYADHQRTHEILVPRERELNAFHHGQADEARTAVQGIQEAIIAHESAERPSLFAPRKDRKAYRQLSNDAFDARQKLPSAVDRLTSTQETEDFVTSEVTHSIARSLRLKTPLDSLASGAADYAQNLGAYNDMARAEAIATGKVLNLAPDAPVRDDQLPFDALPTADHQLPFEPIDRSQKPNPRIQY